MGEIACGGKSGRQWAKSRLAMQERKKLQRRGPWGEEGVKGVVGDNRGLFLAGYCHGDSS